MMHVIPLHGGGVGCTSADMSAPVQSPCVKTCVLDPSSGLCLGCYRTAAEIGSWIDLSDAERQALMAILPARGQLLQSRARVGAIAASASRRL